MQKFVYPQSVHPYTVCSSGPQSEAVAACKEVFPHRMLAACRTSTDPGRGGLSKGAIAGVVVGALVALALVGGALAYALRRRRSMQGWQKEALDGQHMAPKHGNGVELTNSSALA